MIDFAGTTDKPDAPKQAYARPAGALIARARKAGLVKEVRQRHKCLGDSTLYGLATA